MANIAEHIAEPELQFGAGRHVDIRFGLRDYGPFDAGSPGQPLRIRVGVVGTPETTQNLAAWFEKLRAGIPGKESKFVNRYIGFPGFGEGRVLSPEIQVDDAVVRTIPPRRIQSIIDRSGVNRAMEDLAELFFEELQHLAGSKNVDVLVCAPPSEVYLLRYDPRDRELGRSYDGNGEMSREADGGVRMGEGRDEGELPPELYDYRVDFHDLLKA